MYLGEISVGGDSTDFIDNSNDDAVGNATVPAASSGPSATNSLLSIAASAASAFAPKTGIPVSVGLSPQTTSLIAIALFGVGGLFLISMMRK
jgi:hypothetical protein